MVSLRAGCDARFQSGITVKNKAMMTFQKAQVWLLQTGHGGSCPVRPAMTQVPGPAPDALWPRPAPDSWRRESASAPAGPSLCPSWVDQRALSGRHLGVPLSQRTQEGRSLSAQQGVRRRAVRSLSSLWLSAVSHSTDKETEASSGQAILPSLSFNLSRGPLCPPRSWLPSSAQSSRRTPGPSVLP